MLLFFGIDDTYQRINISGAKKREYYRCPLCNELLIQKKGRIKVHHFAHKQSVCDEWYSESKGVWHREIQSYFSPKYQEIIIYDVVDCLNFHVADIFMESKKIIV